MAKYILLGFAFLSMSSAIAVVRTSTLGPDLLSRDKLSDALIAANGTEKATLIASQTGETVGNVIARGLAGRGSPTNTAAGGGDTLLINITNNITNVGSDSRSLASSTSGTGSKSGSAGSGDGVGNGKTSVSAAKSLNENALSSGAVGGAGSFVKLSQSGESVGKALASDSGIVLPAAFAPIGIDGNYDKYVVNSASNGDFNLSQKGLENFSKGPALNEIASASIPDYSAVPAVPARAVASGGAAPAMNSEPSFAERAAYMANFMPTQPTTIAANPPINTTTQTPPTKVAAVTPATPPSTPTTPPGPGQASVTPTNPADGATPFSPDIKGSTGSNRNDAQFCAKELESKISLWAKDCEYLEFAKPAVLKCKLKVPASETKLTICDFRIEVDTFDESSFIKFTVIDSKAKPFTKEDKTAIYAIFGKYPRPQSAEAPTAPKQIDVKHVGNTVDPSL